MLIIFQRTLVSRLAMFCNAWSAVLANWHLSEDQAFEAGKYALLQGQMAKSGCHCLSMLSAYVHMKPGFAQPEARTGIPGKRSKCRSRYLCSQCSHRRKSSVDMIPCFTLWDISGGKLSMDLPTEDSRASGDSASSKFCQRKTTGCQMTQL